MGLAFRAELRQRCRAWLAVALLIAVVGGVTLSLTIVAAWVVLAALAAAGPAAFAAGLRPAALLRAE